MDKRKKSDSVLIVEDDPIIARVLESILRDCGYLVDEPVNSGEKALNRVISRRPDIVLMDIDLLGPVSGIDTAKILLHLFNIPVIFVTGHDEEEILYRATEADPFGFLVKPVHQNILNSTIRIAINLHQRISGTTEGKTGGLQPDQREMLSSAVRSMVLMDDQNRIIWMNNAAEFLLEFQTSDLLLSDGKSTLRMQNAETGEPADPFSLDLVDERPLRIMGSRVEKRVIPRIFLINDPFGDIGGYLLELNPAGETG